MVVLVFLFLLDRLLPAFPGPLLAVLRATVAVALFDLEAAGITVIGPILGGLPIAGVSLGLRMERPRAARSGSAAGGLQRQRAHRTLVRCPENQQIDANQGSCSRWASSTWASGC